jgi:hypothetical protein
MRGSTKIFEWCSHRPGARAHVSSLLICVLATLFNVDPAQVEFGLAESVREQNTTKGVRSRRGWLQVGAASGGGGGKGLQLTNLIVNPKR